MNINTLAKMTSTSKETIRLYREKGLLHPEKNIDNNYFIYTMRDFCTVMFIKKMRYFNMSLNNIKYLLNRNDPNKFIEQYDKQIESLQQEEKRIRNQIKHLKMAKEYLESSFESEGRVIEKSFISTRYDIYPDLLENKDKHLYDNMILKSDIYINTIYISRKEILCNSLDKLKVYIGLGIDDQVIKQYKVKVPSQALIFPSGMYLVTMVKITQLNEISRNDILPIIKYAEANNYNIVSGITSFLAYIDHTSHSYYYRIRVQVEKKI